MGREPARAGPGWSGGEQARQGDELRGQWDLGGGRGHGNAPSRGPRAVLEGDSADDSQAGGEVSCWRTVTWRLI